MPHGPGLTIRNAHKDDAAALWDAVRSAPELDDNSWYCYFLLCTQFSDTVAVAERPDGTLAGFITAFPAGPDSRTLFIWQMWVAQNARQQGTATALAEHLLTADPGRWARIQATVDPANTASLTFFARLAANRRTVITAAPYIHAEDFPQLAPTGSHPAEHLVTVPL